MPFVNEGPWANFIIEENTGGNPYDYLDITFATVEITSSTPPEEGDLITSINASCIIQIDGYSVEFNNIPQQLTQIVVPVMSGYATTLELSANNFTYITDEWNADAETTGTGGVSVSSDSGITVTGNGTISINWINS